MSKVTKQIKLIVVGSCGVGKTALITKYQKKIFISNTSSTVSPASSTVNISLPNDVIATMQVWDTAGQERFQSISTMFYRDSNVAFVCFDYNSFDTIDQWITRVITEEPKCKIILVLTKADLLDQEKEIDVNARGNQIKNDKKVDGFYMTSAVDGLNVEEIFYEAALIGENDEERKEIIETADKTKESSCC